MRRGGRNGVHPALAVRTRAISLRASSAHSTRLATATTGSRSAGGIGMVLWEAIRGFAYAETAAVLIIIVISVTALDMLSTFLRRLVI